MTPQPPQYFRYIATLPNRHLEQQVYVLGCNSDNVILIRLDEANGVVDSTVTYSTYYSVVGGASSETMFRIEALQYAVVAARSASDEVLSSPRYRV